MKNSIKSWHLAEDARGLRVLAQAAWDKFDEEGLIKYQGEAMYYEGLANNLDDLAWHWACLTAEGVFED